MSLEKTKPGDTIEIVLEGDFFGHRFTVVECPEDDLDSAYRDDPWVELVGRIVPVPHGYKIVDRGDVSESGSVDKFLKRQLNANLDSVFG